MPLSWNEIGDRALAFSREWVGETRERAEAKTFWDDFFHVFGVSRRRVASFEEPVKRHDGSGGFIDLLWKGVLVVEHKSEGKDLDRAYGQALDYFPGLKDRDLPRYVLVSDFARFRLYDLERDVEHDLALEELPEKKHLFAFMAGYETRTYGEQDPVNIKAAERLGLLHDRLLEVGYSGHPLEVFLVRVLFCLFAEDTAIFERRQMQDYLEIKTAEDGGDVGMHLAQLFEVLNTEPEARQATLDESLDAFPYINGLLFAERLPVASFDRTMRETLLDCCAVDWSEISPAIFGSLFQSIMDAEARRNLGAHYTSEQDILKLLGPLFLNSLRAEFNHLRQLRRGKKKRLRDFQLRLSNLRFFDPACGCGNFLVVAYRELRALELEVLRELHGRQVTVATNLAEMGAVQVDVDQFSGIEIEEFPAQIAQVALWLTDHQMNLRASKEFGQYFVRLPLDKSPHIVHGNALELDWRDVTDPDELSFILGNPPYAGKKEQSEQQRQEVKTVFSDVPGAGVLDYVACWYRKAVDLMQENTVIQTAFVSTNSITQGEQVAVLWGYLLDCHVNIRFAHRTFQWRSEASGRAAVHCVIIGFSLEAPDERWLFEYDDPRSIPHARRVNRINPYLVDGPDTLIMRRNTRINPEMPLLRYGSMPIDRGHLIFQSEEERATFLELEPEAADLVRRYGGGNEAISNNWRYCLWLVDVPPNRIRSLSRVRERVEKTREFRESSSRDATNQLAKTPTVFGEIRQPKTEYLLVPKVSSVNREYIPISFQPSDVIGNGSAIISEAADIADFGILQSRMHTVWVRHVGGAMKSDLQYSVQIVYNNFPWPDLSDARRSRIEEAASSLLSAREEFPGQSLEDLYDRLAMPPSLTKAHQRLDREVDLAFRRKQFKTDAERLAHLLERYEALSSLPPANLT